MSLVKELIIQGWLKTPQIIKAFQNIKRSDFMPDNIKHLAEVNEALPIGYGQTISQPLTVAFMLELLQPEFGDKILDVGSGSGWTTALLSYIVSENGEDKFPGKVIAIERIPELKEFGEKNVAKYNYINKGIAEFICADGSKGFAREAPFDKILVSASCDRIFPAWKEQLKIGGRIVVPLHSSIWCFQKKSYNKFEQKEYPGFAFVPLIED